MNQKQITKLKIYPKRQNIYYMNLRRLIASVIILPIRIFKKPFVSYTRITKMITHYNIVSRVNCVNMTSPKRC